MVGIVTADQQCSPSEARIRARSDFENGVSDILGSIHFDPMPDSGPQRSSDLSAAWVPGYDASILPLVRAAEPLGDKR